MWTSKAPILLLYIHLFRIDKRLRIACYTLLASTCLGYALGAGLAACPLRDLDSTDPASSLYLAKCAKKSSQGGVAFGSMSVITDLVILIMPIPFIMRMQLACHKKIGLLVVFLSGI